MTSNKAQVQRNVYAVPQVRYEEQQLTSFSGLVLFQLLFQRLRLRERLRETFGSRGRGHYGMAVLFLHLVVHQVLGFRRLRDRDSYSHDPLLKRVLGLHRVADVSTLSRQLSQVRPQQEQAVRALSRALVLDRLEQERLPRVTMDFDGSVLSTRRHAEGTAVGYNPKRKGERSYYPLFCTVAQTGQFLDYLHRSGNVHDSNGALAFMKQCLQQVGLRLPKARLEARMDSAFFDQKLLRELDQQRGEFTASVPFERFPELKAQALRPQAWLPIDEYWSFVELSWRPASWSCAFRFVLLRRRRKVQRKGPLQLDLFVPVDTTYEYKVIVTNKSSGAGAVLFFHNGRGSQEALLGQAKDACALAYIPMKRRLGNQLFTTAALMAHNLGRELQMQVQPRERTSQPQRPALWPFQTLAHLRTRLLQRAGRLTNPKGSLTLTVSANAAARSEFEHFLQRLAPS